MKSISKLKDEARRHEQKEEWEKAIQAYLQVIRAGEEGEGEVELPLFNRIGDLMVRLGRPQEAVRYYEQAADRYADVGLFNNAIALCNKALRYQPEQVELMRKLGQFSASQGFLTDARRYFLEYAERKFATGDTDTAFAALEDFAAVAEDGDVRELLGRRLHTHGRTAEALDALRRAQALHEAAGDAERAAAVMALIHTIAPAGSPDYTAGAQPMDDPADPFDEMPGDDEWEAEPDSQPGEAALVDDVIFFEQHVAGADVATDDADSSDAAPVPSLPDLEVANISRWDPAADSTIEGFETTTLDFGGASDDYEPAPGLLERDGTGFDSEPDEFGYEVEDASSPALPALDDGGDTGPHESVDLPLLEVPAGSGGDVLVPEGGAADWDYDQPGDEGDDARYAAPADDDSDWEDSVPVPTVDYGAADEYLDEGDDSAAVEVEDIGAAADLRDAAQQELDAAVAAPQYVAPGEPVPPQESPGDEGYVDLGELLVDDEPRTTRFITTETAPTGDDDADFAELLSQFKLKISANLPPDDAAAHYDLALAFKEMGLLDEAIAELQVAFRAERMRLKICEELGDCFIRKRQYSIAEKVLQRGLRLPREDDLELLGVYYHLGRTYEALGRAEDARDAYERVLGLDINFQDVSLRLARL
jgi:tetratricopeptide (TPR) repeat protein